MFDRAFKTAAVLAFAAFLIVGCETKEMEAPPRPDPRPAADVTLKNLSGKEVSISDFEGRPLIVNFWASWCVPCVEEMPRFEQTYETWKSKGLEIVAINLKESREVAEKFMKENGYSFITLLDKSGEASDKFQVFGLPTTFFIDREGIIRYSHMGKITPEIILTGLESISLTEV
ncbi:MAG: TlpA disulfide reductase family protein [Candidatus Nitrospinota bacterium M3_3B_026]